MVVRQDMSVFNFSLPLVTAALLCSHTASATSFGDDVIQIQWSNSQNLFSKSKNCNNEIIASTRKTEQFPSKCMANNIKCREDEDEWKSISNEEFTKDTTCNNSTINTTNKIVEIKIDFKKANGNEKKAKSHPIYKQPNNVYISRKERDFLPFKKTLSELERQNALDKRQNAPYTLGKKDLLGLAKQDIHVSTKDLKLCIKTFSKKSPSPSQQNIEKWTKDGNTAYRKSSEYVKKSITGSNFYDCLNELRKKTKKFKYNIASLQASIITKHKDILLHRNAERNELLKKCNLAKIESRSLEDVVKEARKVLSSQNRSWTMNQKIDYLIWLRNRGKELAKLLNYHGLRIKLSEMTKQNLKYLADKEGSVKTRKNNKAISHDNFSTKSTFDSATKNKNQCYYSSYSKFKTTRPPYVKKSATSVSATKKFATNVSEYTKIYMPPVQFYGSSYNTCKTTGTPYIKKSATGVSATNVSEYTRYTMIYMLPAK